MKKSAKILTLLLVLALLVCGVVLAVNADAEPAATQGKYVSTAYTTPTPDSSLSGYTYLVYANEAAFLADINDGNFDGTDATKSSATTLTEKTNCYVYLLQDVSLESANSTSYNNFIVNMGGKTLDSLAQYECRTAGATFAFVNGTIRQAGSNIWNGFIRANGNNGGTVNLYVENVTVTVKSDVTNVPSNNSSSAFFGCYNGGVIKMRDVVADATVTNAKTGAFVRLLGNVSLDFEDVELMSIAPFRCYDNATVVTGTVNVDGSCKIKSAGFWRNNPASGSNVTINVAAGALLGANDYSNPNVTYNYDGSLASSGDSTYPYVVAKPTFVEYASEGGAVIKSYTDTALTIQLLQGFTAGSYVEFYSDMTVYNANSNYNLSGSQDGVVLDFNGYTVTADATNDRFFTPPTGRTLTVKDANWVINGDYTLVFGRTDDQGTIKFVDCTITQNGATSQGIIDHAGGTIEFYGCTIVTNTEKTFFVRVGGTHGLKLAGTKVVNQNASGFLFNFQIPKNDLGTYNVEVCGYNGEASVLQSANQTFKFSQVSTLNVGTRFTLDISDAVINSANHAFSFESTPSWSDGSDKTKENIVLNIGKNVYSTRNADTFVGTVNLVNGATQMELSNFEGLDTDGKTVGYAWGTPESVDVYHNLTLESDLNYNLRLPTTTNVKTIKYNGEVIFDINNTESYEMFDGMYEVRINGIAPSAAAEALELTITYAGSDVGYYVYNAENGKFEPATISSNYTANGKTSVVKYCLSLLARPDDNADVKNATDASAKAILNYIKTAYAYFKTNIMSADVADKINAALAGYVDKTDLSVDPDQNDFVGVNVVAQFKPDSAAEIYLVFDAAYKYSVKIDGNTVKAGTANEVSLNFRAYDLANNFEITVGGETVTYSLLEYAYDVAARSSGDTALVNLLKAMCTYADTSAALKVALESANEGML